VDEQRLGLKMGSTSMWGVVGFMDIKRVTPLEQLQRIWELLRIYPKPPRGLSMVLTVRHPRLDKADV
jgi:hypothetical protein